MRNVLVAAVLIAGATEVRGQSGDTPPAAQPSRTMASLLAEGYEMQRVRVFKDQIWLRKPSGEAVAYVCDRGRIGSAVFESYRNGKYDDVPCSPVP